MSNNGVVQKNKNELESWHLPRLIFLWVVVLVFTVLISIYGSPELRANLFIILTGTAVLASFILQLSTGQREGFITRVAFSSVVSAVIVGLATLFFWLPTLNW